MRTLFTERGMTGIRLWSDEAQFCAVCGAKLEENDCVMVRRYYGKTTFAEFVTCLNSPCINAEVKLNMTWNEKIFTPATLTHSFGGKCTVIPARPTEKALGKTTFSEASNEALAKDLMAGVSIQDETRIAVKDGYEEQGVIESEDRGRKVQKRIGAGERTAAGADSEAPDGHH